MYKNKEKIITHNFNIFILSQNALFNHDQIMMRNFFIKDVYQFSEIVF